MTELSPRDIEQLVAAHPLPEGVREATMNRTEIAAFFDVSLTTISAWITDGMPVLERGRQGQEYQFSNAACFAWKAARDAGEEQRSAEAREAITAMRLQLVGGGAGETELAIHPKERKLLYEVEHHRLQLEAERNKLMRREDVAEMLTRLFVIIRDTVEFWPDVLEREGVISDPAAVDKVVTIGDRMIETLHRAIEQFFMDRPRGQEPAPLRETLFDV